MDSPEVSNVSVVSRIGAAVIDDDCCPVIVGLLEDALYRVS
jgi:hypothetical protein